MTAQAAIVPEPAPPEHCVIVVDEGLAPGLAANAAAVLALTLGARAPTLVGEDFRDADGESHPGLIPFGLPVLRAPRNELAALRERARAAGLDVLGFPTFGQQTNDYAEFRARVARVPTARLQYLGLAVCGPRRAVRKLTGSLPLLR